MGGGYSNTGNSGGPEANSMWFKDLVIVTQKFILL
jgi:hypothetical protein